MRDAIESLARMHAGAALSTDSAVQRMAHLPSIARALQRLARSTAPITTGRVVATLPDTTVFAEGVDADPRTDALYVASIKHRTIYEIRADGAIRDLRLSGDARITTLLHPEVRYEVTDHCNASCVMCPRDKHEHGREHGIMDQAQYEKSIDEVVALGARQVVLT